MNPSVVYHYCSTDTFFKIVEKSQLRMFNIMKSNDSLEVTYCLDEFRKALKIACIKHKTENPENGAFREFFESLDIDSVIDSVNNESLTYYAICFSEDGDLLSQWRGYADDAKGIAIGFNTQMLKKSTDYKNFKYNPIQYQISNVKDDLIKYILSKFKSVHCDSVLPSRQDYENALQDITSAMVYNAVFYKSPAFKEEKEWRLVYYPFGNIRNLLLRHKARDMSANQLFYDRMIDISQNSSSSLIFQRNPISFLKRNNSITSFVDINFNQSLPYFIPELVLGPKCEMDDLDFRLFLVTKGIDLTFTKIHKSSASYR